MRDSKMAYYDYFKNAKPAYDMPSYSDVQGGVQGQAISGRSTYKPYSETVRTQAAALPAYYEQARARDWQTQQGILAQQGIDIEKDKLKQSTIEGENIAIKRENDLDLQKKQNQWYKRMGYTGLGMSALKATAPVWAPYATGLLAGGTGTAGAFAGSAGIPSGLSAASGTSALSYLGAAAAPAAIVGLGAWALNEATQKKSKGGKARTIAEGAVGSGYTPNIEAVNLKLIEDYDMNKTTYGRVTMQEVDKFITEYGSNVVSSWNDENKAELSTGINELLNRRSFNTRPDEKIGQASDIKVSQVGHDFVDVRYLADMMPQEDFRKMMDFLKVKYPYAEPRSLKGKVPQAVIDSLEEDRKKAYTYINPADLKGFIPDENIEQYTNINYLDTDTLAENEAKTAVIVGAATTPPALPEQGSGYSDTTTTPEGAQQTGTYGGYEYPDNSTDDFASTYESVYGESYQAGSGQKNDDKSVQQAVAIGR